MNCLRCACYAVHAWVTACLVALMFSDNAWRPDQNASTDGTVYWTFFNYDMAKTITNVRLPKYPTSLY